MQLTDICCNLTHDSFAKDEEAVVQRACDAGVSRLVLAGATLKESEACIQLAHTYANCWAVTGVHPHHASEWSEAHAKQLRQWAQDKRVLAIGECGLDYNRDFSPRPIQRRVFTEQLELARELELPVLLHNREADADFLDALDAVPALQRRVLHCFTGGESLLHACLERDMYIGVTGWFCDERRGGALREVIDQVPLDRLMLETDAPYLLPRTLKPMPRTRRNEPMWLAHIAEQIAQSLDLPVAELARRTQECAQQFFAFPNPKSS